MLSRFTPNSTQSNLVFWCALLGEGMDLPDRRNLRIHIVVSRLTESV